MNTGSEPQKSGIDRDRADEFISECKDRFGARWSGSCACRRRMRIRGRISLAGGACARHGLGTVSMGMSADFEIAIACGATWVRVGSAIFGSR